MPKKGKNKKMYIAAIVAVLLIALAVGSIAFVYNIQHPSKSVKVVIGVQVGDTFDYNLTGASVLFSQGAVTPAYLSQYNDTDYYRVAITGINGTKVYFTTDWVFLNGTDIPEAQWVDVSNGNQSDPNGFWGIYSSNLNVGDLTRPGGDDGITVNDTGVQTYGTNTNRTVDYFSVSSQFYDVTDPTQSTYQDVLDTVYFDQQTGMLTALTNEQEFNNPEYTIVITWQLFASSVWTVQ